MKTPNNDNLQWADISQEVERTYHYPDGSRVSIQNPVALSVSEGSGNHRVVYEEGGILKSVYVKNDWRFLTWEVEHGTRPFIGFGPDIQEQLGLDLDSGPEWPQYDFDDYYDALFMNPSVGEEGRCDICGKETV